MRILVPLICLLMVSNIAAQPAFREVLYGTDSYDLLTAARLHQDGSVILAGTTPQGGYGWQDLYIEKLRQGSYETVWTLTVGSPHWDEPRDIALTPDGGCLVAGAIRSGINQPYDMLVVKVSAEGELDWSAQYGEDGSDMAVRIFADMYGATLIGFTRPERNGRSNIRLLRIDSDGNELWHSDFGGDRDEICLSADQAVDGSFLIAGYTQSWESEDQDLYLAYVSSDGVLLHEIYEVEEYPTIPYAVLAVDGGFLVAGTVYRNPELEMPSPFLMKVDLEGNILWRREYTDGYFAEPRAIARRGAIIMLAGFAYDGGQPDGWVQWSGPEGGQEQQRTMGGEGWEEFRAVIPIAESGMLLAGFSSSNVEHIPDFYRVHINQTEIARAMPDRMVHEFKLWNVHPNPFNSRAMITFDTMRPVHLQMTLHDILGREVIAVSDRRVLSGEHRFIINSDNLASGVYFARAKADGIPIATVRLVHLK